MAERGKPLSFATREQIKSRRAESTVRGVAKELKVSKTTVQKYGKQFGTKR
jgi:response regulator of citrate/malate metabolism